jgi:hypothetical protein
MIDKFMSSLALAVVLQVVLGIALAILSPKEANAPADERERLFELRATSLAYHVVLMMLMVVVIGAPIVSLLYAHRSGIEVDFASAVLPMANGVVLSVILGEVAKYAWQIVQFRRDAVS